jgi:transcriptional regulator with XRE-family HTH domain
MQKSPFSKEYRIFLRALRAARKEAGLTQDEVAAKLGQTQSFVSKCERGERRIDVIELYHFCDAFGIRLADFVRELLKDMGE